MYVKAPPAWSWTGFYIGGNAGYDWSQAAVVGGFVPPPTNANQAAAAAANTLTLNGNGFTGGGQAGFNYQKGAVVWGLEADINSFRTSASATVNSAFPVGGVPITTTNSFSTNWLATVRPRAGLSFGRSLLYVTGGLAVTDIHFNSAFTSAAGNAENAAISTTKGGWTVGGGWEYAFLGNWSGKIEYLYMDFGHVSTTAPTFFLGAPDGFALSHDVHLKSNLVRAGLNYRF